jgi:fluoride exporter
MGEGAELRASLDFGLEQRNEGATGYIPVFIGGGPGSTLRHTINMVCPRLLGTAFPYHTFIINIFGSTVMGLIAGYLAFMGGASQPWRLFLMTGILGGYTTFSAFSLDAAMLYEKGEIGLAAPYVVGSVVLSIACSPVSRWCAT